MNDKHYSPKEIEEGESIQYEIGSLMTHWQGIEFAVCEIYLSFFNQSLRDVPAVAYHAIKTFDARMKVVDALMSHFCHERYKEWSLLTKKIQKPRSVRNAVAHGMIAAIGKSPKRKWIITENPHNLQKFIKSPTLNDGITIKEMRESKDAMVRIIKALDSLRTSLEADSRLQSKLLLQQTDDLENCRIARVVVHERTAP